MKGGAGEGSWRERPRGSVLGSGSPLVILILICSLTLPQQTHKLKYVGHAMPPSGQA